MKTRTTFILSLTALLTLVAGNAFGKYSGGSGTAGAPYQIATKADLLALAADTNDYNKCFILTADINMTRQVFTGAIISQNTIVDTYFQGTAFTGTFDGNDHKITNFTINGGSNSCLGLFGQIIYPGYVKNLGLENFVVSGFDNVGGLVGDNLGDIISNCYSTGTVSGSSYVGGLVGSNSCNFSYSHNISNCYSTGNVSGSSYVGGLVGINGCSNISSCYSTGQVSGFSTIGGLVGDSDGSISNCYSAGMVSGDPNSIYVGGLLGKNCGSISYCSSTGSVSGGSGSRSVGGLVGGLEGVGSISSCYSTGAVSGSGAIGGLVGYSNDGTISNCYSTGSVSGSQDVGGLVGDNDAFGSISNCYSVGTVSGSSSVGGLVGYNDDIISNCYSTGTVSGSGMCSCVGGLVGYNDSIISNCYSTGTVSGSSYVGGLVGDNGVGSISSCYSTGSVSGSSYVGGLVGSYFNALSGVSGSFWDIQTSGQTTSAGGEGKTTAQMKTLSTFTSAGWNFDDNPVVWFMPIGGYPIFFGYSGGSGMFNNPYQIATKADLLALAADTNDYCQCFILTADIDLQGQVFTAAIIAASSSSVDFQGTAFTGTFDGNGHKITNFSINGGNNSYLGLFGQIIFPGSIKNLGLENFSVRGFYYVGGLVGYNTAFGSISNCFSVGMVSGDLNSIYVGGLVGYNAGNISYCYSTGTVSGSDEIGGLVGSNGTWVNSYTTYGTISNCYSTGAVSGSQDVGGLVGDNTGTYEFAPGDNIISNCYSRGTVSGDSYVGGLVGYSSYDTISICYSTGAVSGSDSNYVGGLVGYNDNGSVSNCYSTGSVSGSSYVGGLVGDNTDGGSISNCFSTGMVSGDPNSIYVGGLVGYNDLDDIGSSISNCYSTGAVSGSQDVGGLVGCNGRNNEYERDSTISNCYSMGSVSGSSYVGGLVGNALLFGYIMDSMGIISNCYSTGTVSGDSYVGGLVGCYNYARYDYDNISGSFWDIQTSGQTTSAGGTNETTVQMKTLSTFTSAGWDFTNGDGNPAVWFMPIDWYPILSWQSGVPTSTVNVPDVVGMTQANAQLTVTSAGLVICTVTKAYSNSIAEGNVISQSPTVGTTVLPNTAVDIVVSLGASASTVNVPNVVGMTQTNAQSAITSAGLVVGTVTTAYSNTVATGNVISQSITAGTTVLTNTAVAIVVSLGASTSTVNVPNVVGMTQTNAQSAITSANLMVGTVTTAYSNTVTAGNIISQNPTAGTTVLSNTAIDIVVSLGTSTSTVNVPNVVGMTQTNAQSAITSAGLIVGTVTTAYSNTVAAGSVISQSPTAGIAVAVGSSVNYVESLGKPTVPNILGMAESDSNTAIVDAGLEVGTITTAYSDTVAAGAVISQKPLAGTKVAIGSKVSYVKSLGEPIVPNVIGKLAVKAKTIIKSVGNLKVGTVTTAYSDTVAKGEVISQSPSAGTAVMIGSTVNYVKSLGEPAVPKLVGKTVAVANTAITSVGLNPVNGGSEYSNKVAAGKVISQSPIAGTKVLVGSSVSYVESLGKPTVPNVVGMTAADANTAIATAGGNLKVGTITAAYSDTVAAGVVISQSPVAGKAVTIGSKVKYVISMGKK